MHEHTIEEPNVCITVGKTEIWASLRVPRGAKGVVIFVHGSGSGRHSPRNRFVASALEGHGIGTLLVDLLSMSEARLDERTAEFRFDIGLLARRVAAATSWLRSQGEVGMLPIGYFGASTGAAAALVAAASAQRDVCAVVSRGGRPDLAGTALTKVMAPTLLIVGSADPVVVDLNRRAAERMHCLREVVEVEGAGHLFEEPGALERVAALAVEWFLRYFSVVGSTT